jgi:protein-tyrosine phosphatase
VQALTAGQIVAFPTETVYGLAASALLPDAVERLVHAKGRPEDKPLTLALRHPAEAADWAPKMSQLGRRLSRRCWPGPVTLVFQEASEEGLASRLSASVRQRVCPTGTLGLRVPAHEALKQVLQRMPGPVVLTSANRSGEPDATNGQQVIDSLGDQVQLVIDDGPTSYGQPSTVVRVDGERWELLREGVMPAETLERLSSCAIVFVCTGNTCRSPLAEGLCKKALSEQLGCSVEDLPRRGFLVLSAGTSAMMGSGATQEAIETAQARGVDLTGHVSQPATSQLLAHADFVWAMTRSHLQSLLSRFPRTTSTLEALAPDGSDVSDPIGGDRPVYEACADQIWARLQERLPALLAKDSLISREAKRDAP